MNIVDTIIDILLKIEDRYLIIMAIVGGGIAWIWESVKARREEDKLWEEAANPENEYHWYWVRVNERIDDDKERKKLFIAAVYFEKNRI